MVQFLWVCRSSLSWMCKYWNIPTSDVSWDAIIHLYHGVCHYKLLVATVFTPELFSVINETLRMCPIVIPCAFLPVCGLTFIPCRWLVYQNTALKTQLSPLATSPATSLFFPCLGVQKSTSILWGCIITVNMPAVEHYDTSWNRRYSSLLAGSGRVSTCSFFGSGLAARCIRSLQCW